MDTVKSVKSTYRYVRISAFKVRDVARAICGLPVSQALSLLQYTPKKAAVLLRKTLQTAIADAEHNYHLNADLLVVQSATADEGPTLSRAMPRARGSGGPIRKRSSHISVVVAEKPEEEAPKRRNTKGYYERAAAASNSNKDGADAVATDSKD
jgi:large subunit ribosomal protein L22